MRDRYSLLFLVVGALAGYLLAGSPASAQNQPLPVAVGDTATLVYEPGAQDAASGTRIECSVQDVRGSFLKCGSADPFRGDQVDHWRSLRRVTHVIVKHSR
jgi:hypothetical protein